MSREMTPFGWALALVVLSALDHLGRARSRFRLWRANRARFRN